MVANGTTQTASGSIYTNGSGTSGYALWALNGGTIVTTGPMSIGTNGSNTAAVVAQSGGTISLLTGTTIYPNGSNSYSLYASGAGSTINATGITTSTTGVGSNAVVVDGGGLVNLLGASTIYTNASSAAALYATGTGSTINVTGGSIFTSGAMSYGADAESGAAINLFGGVQVTTNQSNASALFASGSGSTIVSAGSIIRTNGQNSEGAQAVGGALVQLSGGSIATNGMGANGMGAFNGSVLSATNVTTTTTGYGAFGATSQFGSTLTLSGGSIATGGTAAAGLLSGNTPGTAAASIVATGLAIGTSGADAYGALVTAGSSITLNQSSVQTTGSGAAALYGLGYGDGETASIDATGSTINSASSYGIYTNNDLLNVTLSGSTLKGVNLLGTVNGGVLNLVAQSNSHLVGAALTEIGSTSNVSLLGGSAWTMQGASNLTNLTLDAGTLQFGTNNTTLAVANAILLGAGGGTIDSNSLNGTIYAPFSGTGFLIKASPGTATLFGNSNYTGATYIEGGTLLAGQANVFSPYSTMWVGSNGTMDLGGFNQTVAAINNAGVINFGPASTAGTILTVSGNYKGYGGTIVFNTILGSDDSTTDRMIVQGSTSGSSYVTVNNAGGSGAATIGDGILLIEVDGSSIGVFTLSGRVAAGAYEYDLFQGGIGTDASNGNWYLRTDIEVTPPPATPAPPTIPPEVTPEPIPTIPVEPTTPPVPTPEPSVTLPPISPPPPTPTPAPVPSEVPTDTPMPVEPTPSPGVPTPKPTPSTSPSSSPSASPSPAPTHRPVVPEEEVPDYRVEVPVDEAAQALASSFGLDELGTYHDRVGNGYVGRAWGRVFGVSDSVGYAGGDLLSRYDSFTQFGPQYTSTVGGLQLGADLLRRSGANGNRDTAGWYLGLGHAQAQVQGAYGGDAGTTTLDGYSLGIYWTHAMRDGAYLDAVGQYTLQDVAAASSMGQTLHTCGNSYILSIEGGAPPIALGGGFSLEPQAQAVYQHVALRSGNDDFGLIEYAPSQAVYGRIGARLVKSWSVEQRPQSAWLRLNVWDSFHAQAQTTFADLNGSNPTTLPTALGGSWLQAGGGISSQVSSHIGVFASVDYRRAFGASATGHGLEGRGGLTLTW
ncbi:MAG TPA: autotransporter outer membrane beta-barrel domain-containing protein [Candidatus Acidoferrales bacterium]|nr:autotransporter outer membrane beta-barrel domain-containing protein [Candidatus Acidoferrales bacterium]